MGGGVVVFVGLMRRGRGTAALNAKQMKVSSRGDCRGGGRIRADAWGYLAGWGEVMKMEV